MDQTGLKIAVAGLMHDIGKFAQGNVTIPKQYAIDNADQYQPFYNNRHSHIHALYTAAFIEQFADKLPPCFNEPGWGDGDSFINLAAGHHNPETAMQWIVTMADRISSGLDRATFDKGEKIAFQDFKKTRLLPLFEGLEVGAGDAYEKLSDFNYRYPLAPLSAGSVFPLHRDSKILQTDANQEYQTLFDTFIRHLGELQHRQTNLELWVSHFDSLLQTCTAMIPAARVGDVIPDVSLYDHARTTAAFASALYQYHLQTDSLDERSIRDSGEEKLLLVTGDFYGIQDFIFSAGGEMKKFRSKLLRGRSFAVSLFSELAADMLCRELGLSPLSVILNAAGKFTLLAANTQQSREDVSKVEAAINDWLFEISCGQASMGIAVTRANTSKFYCNAYGELHDTHMRDVQERKKLKLDLERYSGTMDGYLEAFDNNLDRQICGLCGKRPADARAAADRTVLGEAGVSVCPVCRDHVMLGSGVVKYNRLAILDSADPSTSGKGLHRPLFGRYQLRFTASGSFSTDAEVLKIWQVNGNTDGSLFSDITMRLLNGYVPLYRPEDEHDDCLLAGERGEDKTLELIDQINVGDPKTFSHIALKAKRKNSERERVSGTEAIGVLKADVDDLGLLMGCGLPEKRFTLSRMATLSRQLDAFFSVYLPNLLANSDDFRDIYTVFAGGDDLFLIGPWNKMAYLAVYLKERFAEYVCANKKVTFSAGITVHKAHVPVDKLARATEDALEESKNAEGKNSVTMFGQTVTWENFQALLENRNAMQNWLDKNYISSAMMYRFNHLIALAEQERAALAGGDVCLDDLTAMKWRSMFSYSIQRNINSSLKGEERQGAVQDVSLMARWMDTYGAATRIPLWHLLYDKR
ncbi:MAG TPA: type III-A CRISPR-associated protein Cas10/Csm1 [Thermodesulfobacteriaceae bacterium]|nr:type III-A CRISPR-associated protein Cas10/Csm1 [Thermodesulfobacteriaceae bacterium]